MSGEMDKMKGRAKQAAGDLTDDESLKAEGEVDEASGKAKDTFNDAVDGVKNKIND